MSLLNSEEIPYPLFQNLFYILYESGADIAIEYHSESEFNYINHYLQKQTGSDPLRALDKKDLVALAHNQKQYVIMHCPKEWRKHDEYFLIHFADFEVMSQKYININRTRTVQIVEDNLSHSLKNKIKQWQVNLAMILAAVVMIGLICLIDASPVVNSQNVWVLNTIEIVVPALFLALSRASNGLMPNIKANIYVPKRYQNLPATWLKLFGGFIFTLLAVAIINFHVHFELLLNPKFYQVYGVVWLFFFMCLLIVNLTYTHWSHK